ncbi:ATP-binding cassette domain-containing protein [Paenibacillus sp. H1-7]|uniref:ATP-binding cassette domain-containing protein n=1 Tax=Paenibacillus sp. H1-7 TaxID=2282849 RepID=UPI001EF88782|nr:ATP-binding cassette domain-containing protein [Paenibacillus sp. H1-7]ULL15031.1 ATP-binding cassette domain-containing protein [Paenibacillus sp. H1-7]
MRIVMEHVSVMAGKNGSTPILRDISHEFEQGSVTLVVGRTGSGKSTLLHILSGLLPINAGAIRYGDKLLWDGNRVNEALLLQSGNVFQYPERQLFADSVRKEFAYSLRPFRLKRQAAEDRVRETVRQLELPESIVQESVFTLSDGWKRKAALATTLATRPAWLLLDEPTAGIDPQGIPPLLRAVREHREQSGGGVVIASHDLDAFLPAADRVVVMRDGCIRAVFAPEELHDYSDVLLEAHVGLPASAVIARELQQRGIVVAGSPLTPEATASAIVQALRQKNSPNPVRANESELDVKSNDGVTESRCMAENIAAKETNPEDPACTAEPGLTPVKAGLLQLHPIAKWLFYMAVSAGMLLQNGWIGIALSAVLAFAMIRISSASYRTVSRASKAFFLFIVISSLISGLQITVGDSWWSWKEVSFSFPSASRTFQQLVVFLIVLVAGVAFLVTTNASAMQRGLEQALSPLERFLRIPISIFTFSASLLLRFIPLIGKDMDRMSLIVKSRGKSNVKPGSIRLRDTPGFMIPLLLSMMKQAEDMALVLEARGYKFKRSGPSARPSLAFTRNDWLAVGAGAVLLILFIVIREIAKTSG